MATPKPKRNPRPTVPVMGGQPVLLKWFAEQTDQTHCTLFVDGHCMCTGVPALVGDAGQMAIGAVQESATVILVEFDSDVSGVQWLTLPAWDPAVRTNFGGFLPPGDSWVNTPPSPWYPPAATEAEARQPKLAGPVPAGRAPQGAGPATPPDDPGPTSPLATATTAGEPSTSPGRDSATPSPGAARERATAAQDGPNTRKAGVQRITRADARKAGLRLRKQS